MFNKNTTDLLRLLNNVNSMKDYMTQSESELINCSLKDYLRKLVSKTGQSVYNIIKRAGLDTSYGYKIFRGEKYPSRNTLLQLAFAMSLNLNETQLLLRLGKVNELYPRNARDATIIFSLNNKFNLSQTDDLLYEHNHDTIVNK